jgi:hypothetical protein
MIHYIIIRKGDDFLDYIIKNQKNVYIRLNQSGAAVTCSEADRQLFEYNKARNICESLPKTLKKMKFKVEAVPEIPVKSTVEVPKPEKKVITGDYEPPDTVTRWVDKFGICDEILSEARQRQEELHIELSNVDREMSNIIHTIEIEPPKDMYKGWRLYKQIRLNRKKRRYIKDEILVLSGILKMDFRNLNMENIKKTVNGLATRKFTLRFVEDDDECAEGDQ